MLFRPVARVLKRGCEIFHKRLCHEVANEVGAGGRGCPSMRGEGVSLNEGEGVNLNEGGGVSLNEGVGGVPQ
ncbi:hypothetical protein DPMN_118160 [Dreissena polymorpha]|uniref:Uncharacterized protein n=1 Tax=Dreissena polymorpha TaxID=45954 RepID=A0A9D4GGV9_DREPO|nr:hypothetical protein DPMN_118160 [Dreissena polymorpha]